MKKRPFISFFAILLMLCWITGTTTESFAKNLQPSPEKKEQSKNPKVAEYQVKALVPMSVGAFITPSYILIFETLFIVSENTTHTFSKPIFKISFFEKIFEHLIAPQAP